MKKSMVLIEVIFSIALFSVIALVTTKTLFSLYSKNQTTKNQTITNLKLESTRLFLIKNNDMSKLMLQDDKLYFNSNLLLTNVSVYSLVINNNIATFNICLKMDNVNKVCQKWKIII